MNIIVKSKQEILDRKLKEYINTKIEKLDQFFHNTQEIIVDINKTSLTDDAERYEANAMILASGTMIHAKERAYDRFAVVDLIYEKLRKQLRKHKEKMLDRRNSTRKKEADVVQENEDTGVRIVVDNDSQHFLRKPTDVDEALIHLRDNELNFIAFRDMKTEKVCVLHAINRQEYGLIET